MKSSYKPLTFFSSFLCILNFVIYVHFHVHYWLLFFFCFVFFAIVVVVLNQILDSYFSFE